MTAGILAMILAIGMTACTKADNTTKTEKTSESDGKKELKKYGKRNLWNNTKETTKSIQDRISSRYQTRESLYSLQCKRYYETI